MSPINNKSVKAKGLRAESFSSLEVEANMAEMGRYFSKKNGVRVITGLGHQKRGAEDMVLGDQNFGDFQEVSDIAKSYSNY